MFRNVSKLNNLLNFYLSSKFVYHTTFHTVSLLSSSLITSTKNDKIFNFQLPFNNFNRQIVTNRTKNFQQLTYFSNNPNRNRNRKRNGGKVGNDKNFNFDSRIPKLVYLHNPLKYLRTKLKFVALKLKWDRKFSQKEFIRGTKQAAVVLTNVIRTQNVDNLSKFTTRIGFHQITRDMILSKTDPRLQMIQFRVNDLRRAIPVKVMLYEHKGYRHCLVDMFFVGMRNVNDFKSRAAYENMSELIKKFEILTKTPITDDINPLLKNENAKLKRVLFAEIFVRFYRDYTDKNFLDNWNVSFYKVLNFDILQIRDTQK